MADSPPDNSDELLDHYDLDFSKAKPNRFAALFNPSGDPKVANIRSPRLVHPKQAVHFIKEVVDVRDE